MRKILALAIAVALASAAVAAAATNGTYAGMSTVTISGFKATHPFSVTVKSGRVVKVALIAGATCADLNGSSGIKAKLPITKRGHFGGTVYRMAADQLAGPWIRRVEPASGFLASGRRVLNSRLCHRCFPLPTQCVPRAVQRCGS